MEEPKKTDKKKRTMTIVVVFLLVVVIIILGFIIYKLLHQEEKGRQTSEGVAVDRGTDDPENPLFTTDMNMVWTFPTGKRTSSDAVIGNAAENGYDVYFEVFLDDEEQTLLYSSPILPVGKRLDKLKLDKALPAGMYGAICTFHLLDKEDNKKEVSDVSFNVTLIFE